MKQITPEIKANIFALYYNQQAVVTKGNYTHKIDTTYLIDGSVLSSVGLGSLVKYQYSIMAKPLSSITDEDAIEAAKHYHGVGADLPPERIRHVVRFINHICRCSRDAADYLRSKGYALPAFGYSVDELVEAGVFKLGR